MNMFEARDGYWKLIFWEDWSYWHSHHKCCGIWLYTQVLSIFLILTNLKYNMFTYFSLATIDAEQFLMLLLANCFYLNKNHMHLVRKKFLHCKTQYNENKFFSFETIADMSLAYFSRNSLSGAYPPPLFFKTQMLADVAHYSDAFHLMQFHGHLSLSAHVGLPPNSSSMFSCLAVWSFINTSFWLMVAFIYLLL